MRRFVLTISHHIRANPVVAGILELGDEAPFCTWRDDLLGLSNSALSEWLQVSPGENASSAAARLRSIHKCLTATSQGWVSHRYRLGQYWNQLLRRALGKDSIKPAALVSAYQTRSGSILSEHYRCDQSLDIPLPWRAQRLVKIVDIEDNAAFGRGKSTKISEGDNRRMPVPLVRWLGLVPNYL
jgi:hypothetical protein